MAIDWLNMGDAFQPQWNTQMPSAAADIAAMAMSDIDGLAQLLVRQGIRPGPMPTTGQEPKLPIEPDAGSTTSAPPMNPQSSNRPMGGPAGLTGTPGVGSRIGSVLSSLRPVPTTAAPVLAPPRAPDAPRAQAYNPQMLQALMQLMMGGPQQMPSLGSLMPR